MVDMGPSGEFSLRDNESQHFLWVRSKGENQETKLSKVERKEQVASVFSGKEQGSPPFPLPNEFAYTHQGTITIQFIFQRTILKAKRSTNNNYTGNISVETVRANQGRSRGSSSSPCFLREGFLDNSSPHGFLVLNAHPAQAMPLAVDPIRRSRHEKGLDA